MSKIEEIKEAAEADLLTFIKLVAPHRVLGSIHDEIIQWWTREDAKDNQLLLMPRDHQKSALIAFRVAWEITRNPAVTILYISSTSNLAEKQLSAIKNILASKIYRRYWPEMIHEQEGKRETWNTTEISIDHPVRKLEGVRDPTVFTAGLTTGITGLHCNIAVLDDVVVKENAYTAEGRRKVSEQFSLLSSIETTDAKEWVVGTRYDPRDLYATLVEIEEEIIDDTTGEIVGSVPVYEVFQREVEDRGDGTGEFIWPRQQRADGKWFGFDSKVLARKRAKYVDKMQYRAQYYNNPNDPDTARIKSDKFQYYDRKFIKQEGSYWYYKEKRLNVYAAIDFAFSIRKTADYTSIVVIGIDSDGNIYVLDVDRFRTDKISVYFEHILALWYKWEFPKLRAEVTVAQQAIVRELKENYIKSQGISLKVDEYRPHRNEGAKEERMGAILEPRYDNLAMWHYKGGHCQTLEEELVAARPPHDDVMDALASAIDIAVPPRHNVARRKNNSNVVYNTRFGGVAFNGR